jgi:hypothetical protein
MSNPFLTSQNQNQNKKKNQWDNSNQFQNSNPKQGGNQQNPNQSQNQNQNQSGPRSQNPKIMGVIGPVTRAGVDSLKNLVFSLLKSRFRDYTIGQLDIRFPQEWPFPEFARWSITSESVPMLLSLSGLEMNNRPVFITRAFEDAIKLITDFMSVYKPPGNLRETTLDLSSLRIPFHEKFLDLNRTGVIEFILFTAAQSRIGYRIEEIKFDDNGLRTLRGFHLNLRPMFPVLQRMTFLDNPILVTADDEDHFNEQGVVFQVSPPPPEPIPQIWDTGDEPPEENEFLEIEDNAFQAAEFVKMFLAESASAISDMPFGFFYLPNSLFSITAEPAHEMSTLAPFAPFVHNLLDTRDNLIMGPEQIQRSQQLLFGNHFLCGITGMQTFSMSEEMHAVVLHGNCRTDNTAMIGFDRTLLIGHGEMNEGEGVTWRILNDQIHFRNLDASAG